MAKPGIRTILSICLTLLAVTALAAQRQRELEQTANEVPQAVERFVNVGGRRLFISCRGAASPTVIVERGLAGGGNVDPQKPAFGGAWGAIQSEVAKFARVCIYSRANVGRSDPDPARVRTAKNVISDLRALFQNAGIRPPYIIVGHSLGGVYAQMYAGRFPAEVAGMVLVESSHEDQVERLIAAGSTEQDEALPPPEQNRERTDLRATLDELRGLSWKTSIPVIVIARGTSMRQSYPRLNEAQVKQIDTAWHELQRDLAGRSPNGRLVIAAKSGHNVQEDEPDVVIRAIREVMDEAGHLRR